MVGLFWKAKGGNIQTKHATKVLESGCSSGRELYSCLLYLIVIWKNKFITMNNANKTTPRKQRPKKHKGKPKPKMTKEERREKYTAIARDRRDKRVDRNRDKDIICYRCRKKGHSADKCTSAEGGDVNKKKGGNICYKCGSTEHRLQQCAKIKPYLKGQSNTPKIDFGKLGELPFAKCYVCNESGHLSGYCPKGNGILPDGGTCRVCGEGGHIAKNCPKNKKDDDSVASEKSVTIEQYLEDEDSDKDVASTLKKKKKVVSF